MRKMIILLFFCTLLIAGCTKSEPHQDNPSSSEQIAQQSTMIEQLREENSLLQQELSIAKEQVDDEQTRNDLRETLNMTFKLLAAMDSGDTSYIESVLSPHVKIGENKNTFLIENGDSAFESRFITNVALDQLEFRGYEQRDEDRFLLFIARNITTKGSEGNISYEFSFIRSPEGYWVFDGFVS